MRPNLSVILVILALVVSVLVGIVSGGGWQVWLAEPVIDDGVNENVTLPIAPASPTPISVEIETPSP
jgi:hypothetical protein